MTEAFISEGHRCAVTTSHCSGEPKWLRCACRAAESYRDSSLWRPLRIRAVRARERALVFRDDNESMSQPSAKAAMTVPSSTSRIENFVMPPILPAGWLSQIIRMAIGQSEIPPPT